MEDKLLNNVTKHFHNRKPGKQVFKSYRKDEAKQKED